MIVSDNIGWSPKSKDCRQGFSDTKAEITLQILTHQMGETEVACYYSAASKSLAESKDPGPRHWTDLNPLLINTIKFSKPPFPHLKGKPYLLPHLAPRTCEDES